MEVHITIKDIGMIISNVLPKTKFKIKAEVQQPKITNGNMYLKIKVCKLPTSHLNNIYNQRLPPPPPVQIMSARIMQTLG